MPRLIHVMLNGAALLYYPWCLNNLGGSSRLLSVFFPPSKSSQQFWSAQCLLLRHSPLQSAAITFVFKAWCQCGCSQSWNVNMEVMMMMCTFQIYASVQVRAVVLIYYSLSVCAALKEKIWGSPFGDFFDFFAWSLCGQRSHVSDRFLQECL